MGVRSRYYQQQVVDIEVKSRLLGDLPTNGIYEAGGLMYGANTPDLLQCAATYVDKILKGAKPPSSGAAAEDVRVQDQSENSQPDRPYDFS